MASNVFANLMEVSGKASPHKVLASMPDVCLSPPSPPAGPIPIPYPNFAKASDTTGGSKTVKIGGKEVSLKGKSRYKKSTGDEAATRIFGAGVISHSITGPVWHKAGSFDVEVEGSCVVRTMDLTTGNHANPGNGNAQLDAAGVSPGKGDPPDCATMHEQNEARRTSAGHEEKPTTFATATIQYPDGAHRVAAACSNGRVSTFDNGMASGLSREDGDVVDAQGRRGQEASNLCDKARDKFKYNETQNRPHTSHSESRLVESLFSAGNPPAGTSVTISINWNRSNWPGDWRNKKANKDLYLDDNPCDDCHRLLCAAQACDIEIKICDQTDDKAKSIEEKTGKKCE